MNFKVLNISSDDKHKILTGKARYNDFIRYIGEDLSDSEANNYVQNLPEQTAMQIISVNSDHYLKLSGIWHNAFGKKPDIELWKDLVILMYEELVDFEMEVYFHYAYDPSVYPPAMLVVSNCVTYDKPRELAAVTRVRDRLLEFGYAEFHNDPDNLCCGRTLRHDLSILDGVE